MITSCGITDRQMDGQTDELILIWLGNYNRFLHINYLSVFGDKLFLLKKDIKAWISNINTRWALFTT